MKKYLFIILITVLMISACSKKVQTTLRVNNNTSEDIWVNVTDKPKQTIVSSSFKEYFWQLSSGGMTQDEARTISVSYNGYTIFAADTTVVLNPGDYKTLNVKPTGGCIKIANESEYFVIEEVYISPSDSLTWGDNLLVDANGDTHYIEAGNTVSWTCDPDSWDIMVVDDYGDEFTVFNQYIQLDETYIFHYTGFKQKNTQAIIKKKGGKIKGVEKN